MGHISEKGGPGLFADLSHSNSPVPPALGEENTLSQKLSMPALVTAW